MSNGSSGDSFTLMGQIKQIAQEAIQLLTHRHKNIYFDDCPECKLKKMMAEICAKAQETHNGTTQSSSQDGVSL